MHNYLTKTLFIITVTKRLDLLQIYYDGKDLNSIRSQCRMVESTRSFVEQQDRRMKRMIRTTEFPWCGLFYAKSSKRMFV